MADQLSTIPPRLAPGLMPDGIVARVYDATGVQVLEDRVDCRLDDAGDLDPVEARRALDAVAAVWASAGAGAYLILWDGDTGAPHVRLDARGATVYSAAGVRMVHDALGGSPVVVTFEGDALDVVAPSLLGLLLEPDA